jgi:uncharacterized protein YjcR
LSDLPIFIPPDAPSDDDPIPPKKNKGGAPLGNRNALKHGFYSREFKLKERKDLEAFDIHLDDEIKLLRIYMRRLAQLAESFETIDQGLEFLRAISVATNTIGRLMRVRRYLGADETPLDLLTRSMDEAIEALRTERGYK